MDRQGLEVSTFMIMTIDVKEHSIEVRFYKFKFLEKLIVEYVWLVNRSTIENVLGITFGISLFKASFKNQFCWFLLFLTKS